MSAPIALLQNVLHALLCPVLPAAPATLGSRWPDVLPLPPVVTRADAFSGIEPLRQDERAARLLALYQDRLLASRDPDADPDAVARRFAAGLRVKQRLAARQARARLAARIVRDRERALLPGARGVVVALRARP